jgi:hypothetical protein
MGTGPILITDKSTFQMLSSREHSRRSMHFFENVTPVLVTEILGDLTKVLRSGQDPAVKVAELAGKFHGSGGPVNHEARLLVVQSLIGNDIPLTGQVLAQGGVAVDDPHLGRGFMIDLTWWNEAILRWSRGEFNDVERQYSDLWRTVTHLPGFSSLWERIRRHGIILPKIQSPDELREVLDDVTNEPNLQDAWLEILLERFRIEGREEADIRRRWEAARQPLRTFAAYAFHCLKVWVGLVIVVHHKLFRWDPTHIIDVQYMNYLPFCQVFSSNDRLHRILAPALKRDDQTFLVGDDLKTSLKQEADGWDALEGAARDRLRWALTSPLPRRDSVLFQTWVRYMNPRPGTNRVCHLDDEQRRLAIEEAEAMLRDALGDEAGDRVTQKSVAAGN